MNYIESIKILDGVVMNFEYHKRRAFSTTGIILEKPIIPHNMSVGVVKCRIVYNNHEVIATDFLPYTKANIQSLKIVNINENLYPEKLENRSWLNSLCQQKTPCDDVLISLNGKITDTSFCNVVFESHNGLFTPCSTLLNGTKRESLLENKTITTQHITTEDLTQFERLHLINSMLDLGDMIININEIVK